MTEGPLEWADRRVEELAVASAAGIGAAVLRWLADLLLPFRILRRMMTVRIALSNGLAREVAQVAVDRWVADEVGVEVEDLPALESDPDLELDEGTKEVGATVDDLESDSEDEDDLPEDDLPDETDEEARLGRAIDLIFEGDKDQIEKRMARLALSEPLRAQKEAMRHRLADRGVTHWTRVVSSTACDSCADRVGEVRSIEVPFTDHPGCRCSLRPVLAQGWGDEVKEKAFQLRHVASTGIRLSTGIQFGPTERKKS